MKWSNYKENNNEDFCKGSQYVKTDIGCPMCNAKVYKEIATGYSSNSSQHNLYCFKCGWSEQK